MDRDRFGCSAHDIAYRNGIPAVLHSNCLFNRNFIGLIAIGRYYIHTKLFEILVPLCAVANIFLTRQVKCAVADCYLLLHFGKHIHSVHRRPEGSDQISPVDSGGIAGDRSVGISSQPVGKQPFLFIPLLERAPVASAHCVFCVHCLITVLDKNLFVYKFHDMSIIILIEHLRRISGLCLDDFIHAIDVVVPFAFSQRAVYTRNESF